MKKRFMRLMSVLTCVTMLTQSSVGMIPVYAQPDDGQIQETQEVEDALFYGDEDVEASDDISVEYEEASDQEEVLSSGDDEEVSGDEDVVAEDEETSASGDENSSQAAPDGEPVVGGYIEMPWDNNAPVVDDDLDYDEALEMMVDAPQDEEDSLGDNDLSIDKFVVEPSTIESKYPEGSDSQVLTYLKNNLPATRNQNPYGTCWAHSAIALTEFYMVKHGLKDLNGTVDKNVNYSELQLAYFCYNKAPDPVNGSTGDNLTFYNNKGDKESFLDLGGNTHMAAQTLMRYTGVMDDVDAAAYSNAATVLSSGLADEYARSKDVAHLKNEYRINIKENPKLAKQAIKENGIVGVSIFANGNCFNSSTNAFYNDSDTTTNHAVAVVGWDDNYPASNFKTDPGSNGAWLVRNSWIASTAFSYYSYFWLSYKDKSLSSTAYVYEMVDKDKGEYYDNNYNYDPQLHGTVGCYGASKVANVFTAVKTSETLKAVQIEASSAAPGAYTVEIYKDLTDSGNPESGTKVDEATTTGTLPFSGKYTIPLNSSVDIYQGETFSVVVSAEGQIDREIDSDIKEQVVMDVSINEGESFAYKNSVWKDLSNDSSGGYYGNLIIRALTNTKGGAQIPDSIKNLFVKSVTEQSVTLSWSASRDADGYEVWYSDSENGSYIKAGETASSERKYKHSDLKAATTYYYKVYPIKNGSRYDTGVSPVISAKTIAATPKAEIVKVGKYTANIKWDALDNCDGYEYRWGRESGGYRYGTTTANEVRLRYLNPGEKFWVEVRSYLEENGNKNYSETKRVEFTTESGTGEAVSNLQAIPYYDSYVKLSWDEQEEALFTIEKSADGTNFETVYTNTSSHVIYIDGLTDLNTEYSFRVKSVFRKYSGDTDVYESEVVKSYLNLPAVVITKATATNDSIKLEWNAVSYANYYSVFRKENSESEYSPLAVVPATGDLTYTDEAVIPGKQYYYRVYSCRTNELTDAQGQYYNTVGRTVPLASVSDLTVSDITQRGATLSWSAIRGAQGYSICEYDFDTTSWVEKGKVDADVTSYTLDRLLPDKSYYYMVKAFTDVCTGSGEYKYFTTSSPGPADASLFTVTDTEVTYDGQEHGVTVECNYDEISDKGFDVYYGKIVNGRVSSYGTSLPVNAGDYKIKINTKDTTYYTATSDITDDDWVLTIEPKTVGLNWENTEFDYDGKSHIPTVTLTGVLASDNCTVTVTGEAIDAGTHTATASSLSNSNYKLPADNKVDFTIAKFAVSDKTAAGEARYGQSGTVDLSDYIVSGAGLKANGLIIGDNNKILTGTTSLDDGILHFTFVNDVTKVGKSAIVTLELDGGKNYEDYTITVTLTVLDKLAQTVIFTSLSDSTVSKTYGDEDFAFTASAEEAITYSSSDENVATVDEDDGTVHILKAGNTVITATAAESNEFAGGSASYTLIVSQKEIGISWSNVSFTYDGTDKAPTAKATGLLNGDTCLLTVDGAQTNAGSSYTATVTAVVNENYKLPEAVTCSFDIKKRPVTITGLSVNDKDYDGTTDAEITGTAAIDNMIDGDDLHVSYGTATFASAGVGEDISVTFNGFELDGDDKDNYNLTAQPADVTADILAIEMSVSSENVEVTYDGEAYGITVNVTKPASGYTIMYGIKSGNYIYTESPTFTEAGDHKVYFKITAPNYKDYRNGTVVKISKTDAALTAPVAKTLDYNGEFQSLVTAGSTDDGVIEYSTDNENWSTDIPTGKDAKEYEVWWKFTPDNNHNEADGGKLEPAINKLDLSVTAIDQTIVYGQTIAVDDSMYTVDGDVASGDELTVDLTEDSANGKIVPLVSIKSGNTDVSDNYDIAITNGDLTVNPAPLTVTPDSGLSKVYGTDDPELTYTVEGLVEGDTIDVISGSLKREDGDDAGEYEIMNDDLSADNYEIIVTSGVKFSVTPKSITGATVTLDNTLFEYNGEQRTVNVSKVELSDGTELANTDYEVSGETTGTNKGNYTVTVTGKGNYKDEAKVSWRISVKPMTVTCSNVNVTYDGNAHGISVDVEDPVSGYTVRYGFKEGTYNLEKCPEITDVGTLTVYYKITEDNYDDYIGVATVTIEQADAVLTAPTANILEYNGASQALVTAGSTNDGIIEYSIDNENWSTTIPTGKDAKDYEVWWRFTPDDNHTGTDRRKLEPEIYPAALKITPDDGQSKEYGDGDPVLIYTIDGLVGDDTKNVVSGSLKRSSGEVLGEYEIENDTLKADNYEITVTAGVKFSITPKSITGAEVILDNYIFEYNGTVQSVNVARVQLPDGRSLIADTDYAVVGASGTNVADYTVTVTGKGNYKDSATENWKIIGANMVVRCENVNVKYDGEPHTIKVNVTTPDSGYTIMYGLKRGEYNLSECPEFTDVVNTKVYYKVSAEGYNDYTKVGYVEIDKSDATITAPVANTLKYNGTEQELVTAGSTDDGVIEYTTGSGAWSTDIPTGKDAGKYDVWWRFTPDNNHKTAGGGKLETKIEKLPLTVKAVDQIITYGESITGDESAYEITGSMVEGEDLMLKLTDDRYNGKILIEAWVLSGGNDVSKNYDITAVNGKLTVNNAKLTVSPNAGQYKVFGESDPVLTYTVTGLVNGETTDVISGVLKRKNGENVGEYEISGDELSAENYDITVTPGVKFAISPKSIAGAAVFLNQTQFVYDDTEKTINPIEVKMPDGYFLNRDTDFTVSGNISAKAKGDYVVSVTGKGNYKDEVIVNWYIVEQIKTMDVTMGTIRIVYDGKAHGIDLRIDEPADGYTIKYENESGVFVDAESPVITDVGTLYSRFVISAKGYEDCYGDSTVIIDPAPVTVKADDKSKTEGDNDPEFTATVTGLIGSVSDNKLEYTFSREGGETPGTYTITPKGDELQGNYVATYETGTFTIFEKKDDSSSSSDKDSSSSSSDKDSSSSSGKDSSSSSSDKDSSSSSSDKDSSSSSGKDSSSSSSGKDSSSSSSGKDSSSSSSEKDSSSSSAKPEVTVSMDKVDGVEVKTVTFNNDVAVKQKLDVSAYVGVHKKYMVYPKGYAKVSKKTMLITPKKPGDITIIACDKENKVWVPKEIITLKADSTRVVEKTIDAVISEGIIDGKLNIEDGALTPDRWESTKPEVAKVDEKTGMITPVSEGKTTIIAYYGTGKNAAKVKFKIKVWDL